VDRAAVDRAAVDRAAVDRAAVDRSAVASDLDDRAARTGVASGERRAKKQYKSNGIGVMEDRRLLVGVGILVLAAAGIGIMLTLYFGSFRTLLARTYTVTFNFPAAPGIGQDSPVQKNGVRIGRVRSLQLLRGADAGVDLTMDIESQYELTQNELPRIKVGSLITGEAVVEFLPASDQQLVALYDGVGGDPPNGRLDPNEKDISLKPMTDGLYLRGGSAVGDPFQVLVGLESDVRSALQSVNSAGNAVTQLAGDVRGVMGGGGDEIAELARETRAAIADFRMAMNDIRSIVGDPKLREQLQQSLDRFPVILDEVRTTLKTSQRTFESFERVGVAAEKTVNNVEEITRPIAQRSDEIVDQVLGSLENLDVALQEFSTLGQRINSSNGTVRRLLEDDDLYWQVKRVLENVEGASEQIRPILDDVRVFSDKIARDPRQLGVKGALDRRPSGTGLK
jgi:phospholipid/cholesterol/gamma-HCH transport system substrate-binding protein